MGLDENERERESEGERQRERERERGWCVCVCLKIPEISFCFEWPFAGRHRLCSYEKINGVNQNYKNNLKLEICS